MPVPFKMALWRASKRAKQHAGASAGACNKRYNVSLYSGGGFGDIGMRSNDIETIAFSELRADRAEIIRRNYPDAMIFNEDLRVSKDDLVKYTNDFLKERDAHLYSMVVSPPCQGMSTNGKGAIDNQVKQGKRPPRDERNYLILPALDVINQLAPQVVVIENVPGMVHTTIDVDGRGELILDVINRTLEDYVCRSSVVDFANFGVPQHRRRLITVCVHRSSTDAAKDARTIFREELSEFHIPASHGIVGGRPFVTLRDAISHLPPLDARHKMFDERVPYHRVPAWNDMQYACISRTPEGQTAFRNNTCTSCGHVGKPSDATCGVCSQVLAKPHLTKGGVTRLVRAFQSAYRRMKWDRPSHALTTTSGVISSDAKGHPSEHRVLSLKEVMIVATVHPFPGCDYAWSYEFDSSASSNKADATMSSERTMLGECIPPLYIHKLMGYLGTVVPSHSGSG